MNNRREFLRAAAAASLGRMAFGQAVDRKLKLGLIGCGWYGMVDVNAAMKAGNVEMAAICDVDTNHLAQSSAEIAKLQSTAPKQFKDYRELIAMPGLDGVIIATPPQWHALQFLEACRKGLDIYCEKPLSYDIREGQAMVQAWKKAGNIVQIGFQRRQPNGYAAAREFIRSGKAGRIVQVDAQIHYRAAPLDNKPQDPPSTLDWDAWCGPAPKLPYSPNIGHKAWRLEKEYGNGHLVDWGIHVIDAVRVILELGTPRSVVATGGLYEYAGKITTPDTLTAHFDFEQCPVVWRHRLWGAAEWDPDVQNGALFYGDKATVFATDGTWSVIPRGGKKDDRQTKPAPESAEMQNRHVANWLEAVRARRQPMCLPDDAHQSATTVHLGMISYYSGGKVTWDAKAGRVDGSETARKLITREYRKPYTHPMPTAT